MVISQSLLLLPPPPPSVLLCTCPHFPQNWIRCPIAASSGCWSVCFLSAVQLTVSLSLTLSGLTCSPPRCTSFWAFVEHSTAQHNCCCASPGDIVLYACMCSCMKRRETAQFTRAFVCVCVWIVSGVCIMTTGGQLLKQLINTAFIRARLPWKNQALQMHLKCF